MSIELETKLKTAVDSGRVGRVVANVWRTGVDAWDRTSRIHAHLA